MLTNYQTKTLIVDNKTDDIQSIIHVVKRLGYDYDTISPDKLSNINTALYTRAILTGGYWYDDPTQQDEHYRQELDFISRIKLPVIGVCLGVQLIASAFGADIMRIRHEHHGRRHIQLTNEGVEELKLPSDMVVYENHTVGIVSAPDCLSVLAISDECIEILKHKSLPITGVQFHPEKLSKQEHADEIWEALFRVVS